MPVNFCIGVDMAKNTFDACFGDDAPVKTFPNTRSGLRGFFETARERAGGKKPLIGVESTGIYHLLLCMEAASAGCSVKVINPIITSKYGERSIRKIKTDALDARLIRLCLANGEGSVFTETPATIVFKQLVREREYLARLKLTLTRRQDAVLLKERAIAEGMFTVNPEILRFIKAKMKVLEQKLRAYRADEQKLLRSIPGVGPLTAAACISEVRDIRKFSHAKRLAAFIGLDPKVHESGTSIHKYRHISKRGNAILRTRLYNAATVAVLHANQFQNYFKKKRSEGKPYRVALVATMNKMARVIHAVWSKNEPYREPHN